MRDINFGVDYDAGNTIDTKITEPRVQTRLCLAEDAVTFAAPSKLGYSAALTARRVGQRKAVLTSAAFLHIIKSISTEGTMSDEGDSDSNAAALRQYGKQNKK